MEAMGTRVNKLHVNIKSTAVIPFITMIIWGSMYVASRIVLQSMPALLLLFLRLSISGALLLIIARIMGLKMIRREDMKELLLVAFLGYFVSNGALLLGIQYSDASFSSLINALSPVTISLFAAVMLGEKLGRKELISLAVAVAGAFVIIGTPSSSLSVAGICFSLISLLVWSYTTIHIKKLTAKYDPIVVTGSGMGLASFATLPSALLWMHFTGETVHFSGSLILPLLYVCVICTAVAHLLWNYALSNGNASECAAFYPFQPVTSMLLGVLFLGEVCSTGFIIGTAMILFSIVIRQMHFGHFHRGHLGGNFHRPARPATA